MAETVEALMEALKVALMAQMVLIPWLSSLGDDYLTFLASEELAPSVVGGLLVSYRLVGKLKGAPSIGGGTTSGCGGSGMEP